MRRSHKHLFDKLRAGDEVQEIPAGLDLKDYKQSRLRQLAVERCIITLGEAATVVIREEPDLILNFPELPEVTGLRNRVVHDYDDIDDEIVWKSVTEFLPDYLNRLRPFVETAPLP